ncbi:hypothetical protein, partial [Treponema endosymbiont of Eucomonympha sp.]|uniref:hypothetical protein n=1 Tax=Treponema endosymbiont of Eucomonympha sp. TaxID=1580831 RepID=UPI001EE72423
SPSGSPIAASASVFPDPFGHPDEEVITAFKYRNKENLLFTVNESWETEQKQTFCFSPCDGEWIEL